MSKPDWDGAPAIVDARGGRSERLSNGLYAYIDGWRPYRPAAALEKFYGPCTVAPGIEWPPPRTFTQEDVDRIVADILKREDVCTIPTCWRSIGRRLDARGDKSWTVGGDDDE